MNLLQTADKLIEIWEGTAHADRLRLLMLVGDLDGLADAVEEAERAVVELETHE